MEPCFDPSDPLDAVESSVERLSEPVDPLLGNPDRFMDDLARQLGDVEQSAMSAMRLPPSEPDESLAPGPASAEPVAPTGAGPTSDGRPQPDDAAQEERTNVELHPERPAMPFFRSDGITPSRYAPRRGGGAGIRNSGGASAIRWCPRDDELVTDDICREGCDQWEDDDSNGHCGYDQWAEERDQ